MTRIYLATAGTGMTPRGDYNAGTTYDEGSVVAFGGGSYASLVNNNTGNQPDISPSAWMTLSPSGGSGALSAKFQIATFLAAHGGAAARYVNDGSMIATFGNVIVNSATLALTAADVGKRLALVTAPGSGLSAGVCGTIQSVQSATRCTIDGTGNTTGSAINGAFVTVGADCSAAFQAALDAMAAAPGGGLCDVPDGVYLLVSRLQIPTVTVAQYPVTIGFVGQTPPHQIRWSQGTSPPSMTGAILFSLMGTASLTLGGPLVTDSGAFSNVLFVLHRALIRTVPGAFDGFGAPAEGLNLINIADCDLEDVSLEVHSSTQALPAPTNFSKGIIFPGLGNGAFTNARRVQVFGFGIGYYPSECGNYDELMAYNCQVAYDVHNMNDACSMGYVFASSCAEAIHADGGSGPPKFLNIRMLNIESQVGGPDWWALTTHITDPSNYLIGDINVHYVVQGVGPSDALVVNGAGNLRISNNGQPFVTTPNGAHSCTTGENCLADATGGAFAVTTPPARKGNTCTVVKTDASANAVTVTASSGTINGAATVVLTAHYQAVRLVCDGTNWLEV